MSQGRPHRSDRYLWRMAGIVAATLVAMIIGAFLGPTPDQVQEFFLHTGREGPTLVLNEIDIIPDNDPVSTPPRESMAGATQGVETPVEPLDKSVEDSPNKQPTPQPRGNSDPSVTAENIPLPGNTRSIDRVDQVEQTRASNQSLDFVLEKFVRPAYPASAGALDRARVITVEVAMYVNEAGVVEHAYVVRSDGGPKFEEAVLEAVVQWEYRPLIIDGEAQGFWDRQVVEFVVTREGIESRVRERRQRG